LALDDGPALRTTEDDPTGEPPLTLPLMPLGQEVMADYATAGLSLKCHPVSLVRAQLSARGAMPTAVLRDRTTDGRWVSVAGIVLVRQRPGTAGGIVFMTLEDETGTANLIVRPSIYDRFRPAARHALLLAADGRVERHGQVVHLLAFRLHDWSDLLADYHVKSRDFH
jgi:error-prone DNA polymerase